MRKTTTWGGIVPLCRDRETTQRGVFKKYDKKCGLSMACKTAVGKNLRRSSDRTEVIRHDHKLRTERATVVNGKRTEVQS